MKKVSGLTLITEFFNSKKSNKIFTRSEYFAAMKSFKLQDSYKDTVRCYLVRAGYLVDFEPGVYRKLKPIPKNLTTTQLRNLAYPKKHTVAWFIRPLKVSTELAKIVGPNPLPRTEAIKRLWKFIIDNKLQDEKNGRIINVGLHPLTKAVFNCETINMFEMGKAVSKHLKG